MDVLELMTMFIGRSLFNSVSVISGCSDHRPKLRLPTDPYKVFTQIIHSERLWHRVKAYLIYNFDTCVAAYCCI